MIVDLVWRVVGHILDNNVKLVVVRLCYGFCGIGCRTCDCSAQDIVAYLSQWALTGYELKKIPNVNDLFE